MTPMARAVPGEPGGRSGLPAAFLPAPETVLLPPDRDVEPISEGQFAAVVRGYQARPTEHGTVYAREGHPWLFVRDGDRVTVRHRSYALPERHYVIV